MISDIVLHAGIGVLVAVGVGAVMIWRRHRAYVRRMSEADRD